MPPSGPSPGHKSGVHRSPRFPYLAGSPTNQTSGTMAVRRRAPILIHIGMPLSSTSALSLPNRELDPPTKMYPVTLRRNPKTPSAGLNVLSFFFGNFPI